jgi:cytochrome c-type biogenesis protein CcmE
MSTEASKYLKFGSVTVLILLSLGYLAYTGVQDSKSYYVTIKELNGMGNEAYAKRLRVAGNVVPGRSSAPEPASISCSRKTI